MGDVHALSGALVWVGVVWALVYGVVRIVNGPVGRAVARLATGEESGIEDESLDALRWRVAELTSRLDAAEKQIAREQTPSLNRGVDERLD